MKPRMLVLMALLCLAGCAGCAADKSQPNQPPSTPAVAPDVNQSASVDSPSTSQVAPPVNEGGEKLSPLTKSDGKIHIDSVPTGATVSLLAPREDKVLGKTPLVVDASQCPGMRFCVMMDMKEFVKQVESITEMKAWVRRFKSDQFIEHDGSSTDYFTFDSGESRKVLSPLQELVAIGPVYELDWPTQDRICALFIPRGVRPSALHSLMPKPGTFPRLKGKWPEILRSKFRLSD